MSLTPKQLAVRRLGGLARAKAFTPDYQRAARSALQREILSANGRKVAAQASQRLAMWRASRPTKLQQIVLDWILGLWRSNVKTEAQIGRYFVDFVILSAYLAQRDQDLAADGYRVLHLAEADILSGAALDQLAAFLDAAQ